DDPTARVHLVAHSHGGNVVLQALSRLKQRRLFAYWASDLSKRRDKAMKRYRKQYRRSGMSSLEALGAALDKVGDEEGSFDPSDKAMGFGRLVFLGTPFYFSESRARGALLFASQFITYMAGSTITWGVVV